jgi:hypothetical protein
MDPALYLDSSYHARWVTAAATLAVEAGIVSHGRTRGACRRMVSVVGSGDGRDDH